MTLKLLRRVPLSMQVTTKIEKVHLEYMQRLTLKSESVQQLPCHATACMSCLQLPYRALCNVHVMSEIAVYSVLQHAGHVKICCVVTK